MEAWRAAAGPRRAGRERGNDVCDVSDRHGFHRAPSTRSGHGPSMSPVSPVGDSPWAPVPSPVAEAGASVAPAAVVRRGRDGRRMNPRSLDNLVPGAGAWKPGDAPHLLHGAR